MRLFRFLHSSLMFLLVLSLIVIVMSGKATAADRPTSEITEDLPDWFSNNGDYVEINWEASDPNDKEIVRIYFWACYYEGEGDCEGAETDVLNGAVKLLNNRNVRNVIIEFNPGLLQNAGVSPREFLVKPSSWRFNISYIDEDKGLLHLPKDDVDSFIGELLKNEASVNLFWTQ